MDPAASASNMAKSGVFDLGGLFHRAATKHPGNSVVMDHPFHTMPGMSGSTTAAELAEHVGLLSSALRMRGVIAGDRVVVYLRNSVEIAIIAAAIARAGGVPVLISEVVSGDALDMLLKRLDRPHVVTQRELTPELVPTGKRHEVVASLMVLDDGGDSTTERLTPGASEIDPVKPSAGDAMLITHTSGTTGVPKLVVHTGASLYGRYLPQRILAQWIAAKEVAGIHVAFAHSRAYTALAIALWRGLPVLAIANPQPENVAALFAKYRPGILETHPNSYVLWEELADDPRKPLAHTKYFSSTFDALHPRTVRRLLGASERRRPKFVELYGQSEIGPVAWRVLTESSASDDSGRSVGRSFPFLTRLRAVRDDDERPSPSRPGHIEARSRGRAKEYVAEQTRYERQESGGWWRMGDIGYRDRHGLLQLLDREVDVIPGFGSALAAEDRLLSRIPELAELVVVPDEDERPTPVIVTKDGSPLSPDTWRKHTLDMPLLRAPIQMTLEELPRTATLKVRRSQLTKQLAGKAAAERGV